MVLADLRNHGKSAGLKELIAPHDIPNAANDLANLVKSQGWSWPDVVIGHSMGGKVTLQYAQSCARGDYGDSVKLPKQVLFLYVFQFFSTTCTFQMLQQNTRRMCISKY